MANTSEERIEEIYNQLSNGDVERVKKNKDYAFIHFHSREGAEKVKIQQKMLLIKSNLIADFRPSWPPRLGEASLKSTALAARSGGPNQLTGKSTIRESN